MIHRFQHGGGVLIEALKEQKLVRGDGTVAELIAASGELLQVEPGAAIIEQGSADNDVYLILAGSFDIIVNGRLIARRGPGDHVGEMAAIQPSQTRSATVIASTTAVVCRVPNAPFLEIANSHPDMWRTLARELARRLDQRNALVASTHDKIRVFVISSAEALPIARAIENAFEYDPFNLTVWTDGVFKASWYPVESLEQQLDSSDFAVAIASPDDVVESRGESAAAARDNVIFELGLFIGRLGRKRSFLLEPRGEEVKLPSDLSGITTIPYRPASGTAIGPAVGPACNKMREIINDLGPNN
ncbi:MAG: cyclic nucleotide-binding domain protein [Gemmatimonadetes bacterium]|nr:cyclic nucleotide-binding domain protein [Gemmatimonadota bacterium]